MEVLHLCLVKHLPRWCLKISGPILLEPYIFRLESGLVFQRRFIAEATGRNIFFFCLPGYPVPCAVCHAVSLARGLLACPAWTNLCGRLG